MTETYTEHPDGSFLVRDLGWVDTVDSPPGVSWMCFPAVEARDDNAEDNEVRVPVRTRELIQAGVDLSKVGAFVWATVNVSAETAKEVQPKDFEPTPPLTADEMALWKGIDF